MAAEHPVDPAIFDPELFAMVQQLIPQERLSVHLLDLDAQLAAMCASSGCDLGSRAHEIASQAGMFGLMRLSGRARSLEHACSAGVGIEAAFCSCQQAAADVRLCPGAGAGAAVL